MNIRIILSKEDSNSRMISKFKDIGFDMVVIPQWGALEYNQIHYKFCIIDMDYVMHGSYN